jgi:ribosomal protein S18 acetylase RimI-like enzyme
VITLRPFAQEDQDLIAGWAEAYELGTYASRARPRGTQAVCHDPESGLFWFIIVSSGTDVGTVWLEPGEGPEESILGIYLGHPSLFGQGIGSAAIRLALDECRRLRSTSVVTLHVRRDNARAIACYEKLGFAITARGAKVLATGASLPVFEMRLMLSAQPTPSPRGRPSPAADG